jgi:hypothetical protein
MWFWVVHSYSNAYNFAVSVGCHRAPTAEPNIERTNAISIQTVSWRLNYAKWSPERAFLTPVNRT